MNRIFPREKFDLNSAARDELDRILSDERFDSPPRRRKMLRYLVEETLAGRGTKPNAVSIAHAVFNRGNNFDHQTDPVVRIEAHRLRKDLASYYVEAGRNNPIRISVPKGQYGARFECINSNDQKEIEPASGPVGISSKIRSPQLLAGVGGVALFLILVGIGSLGWLRSEPSEPVVLLGPALIVEPFTNIGTVDAHLAEGITHEVVNALMRYPNIRIMTLNQQQQSADAVSLGQRSGNSEMYTLKGRIIAGDADFDVGVSLLRTEDSTVIWSESYRGAMTVGNLLDLEKHIAAEIASKLGQPYGAINKDLSKKTDLLQPQLPGYKCVLSAYHYRNNLPGEALYRPVKACLQRTVNEEPEYAEAWAMLSGLLNDDIRFKRVSGEQIQLTRAQAISAAARALALDPDNSTAAIAIAAIEFYQGNYEQAERYSRKAVKSNPYDPTPLAALGFRLVMRGKFSEGTSYMEQAVVQSVAPPGWYFNVIAIDRLMKGEGREMLEVASRGTLEGSALSQSLVAMAYGLLGDKAGARLALERMNKISPGYDPIARFRAHQATDEILEAMTRALNQAGWQRTEQALVK